MTQDNLRTPKQIPSGKYRRLMTLSDEHGVIAALAIDQRGSFSVRHTVQIYEPDAHAVEIYNTIYEQTYLPARRLFV